MLLKHNSRIFALNICAVSFVVLLLLSCTAAIKKDSLSYNSQLLAENSMMKKRLPLMERESDVLKKENRQYRLKIQDLETQNKQLDLELTSLNEKYANDMAMGEEQISYLQETIQKIDKENSESRDALISDNKVLEAKLVRESHALNEQIVVQKAAFNQEREQIMRRNATRELNLSNQLGVLNKKLEARELEISSLKLAISEISTKLGAATTLSEVLRKARDESLAELESVKAANADLNKTMADLSSLLSSQNSPTPTTANP